MSDHENYSVSPGSEEDFLANEEDLHKLICEFRTASGQAPPSEEEIERTSNTWEYVATAWNMSALEFGKEQIAIVELEKKIDAESETVEERRQRIENELNVPTEEQGTFDIALDDIAWLESKTGCRIEEIHRLSSEYDNLAGLFYQNPDDEELKKAFEYYGDKLESMLSETKKYLQSVLARQQKQSVKSSMGVPVKHIQPCARTASRARRSVARPTGGGGGGPGGDDDDGDPDSSDSDPPGPGARARNAHFLNLSKNPYFKPENGQLSHRSWRMSSEGRHAA